MIDKMASNGKLRVNFFLQLRCEHTCPLVVSEFPLGRYCSETDHCLLEGLCVSELAWSGPVSAFTLPLVPC